MKTVDSSEFEVRHIQSYKGRWHDATIRTHLPCGGDAGTEREGRECGSCRNWNGCGQDCDLSGLYCTACGVRADL